jgi:hypothetical protein
MFLRNFGTVSIYAQVQMALQPRRLTSTSSPSWGTISYVLASTSYMALSYLLLHFNLSILSNLRGTTDFFQTISLLSQQFQWTFRRTVHRQLFIVHLQALFVYSKHLWTIKVVYIVLTKLLQNGIPFQHIPVILKPHAAVLQIKVTQTLISFDKESSHNSAVPTLLIASY